MVAGARIADRHADFVAAGRDRCRTDAWAARRRWSAGALDPASLRSHPDLRRGFDRSSARRPWRERTTFAAHRGTAGDIGCRTARGSCRGAHRSGLIRSRGPMSAIAWFTLASPASFFPLARRLVPCFSAGAAALASAVLALVGAINVPIIYFSVKWWNTLHQGASVSLTSAPTMAATMLSGMLIMAFAAWFYAIAVALLRVQAIIVEREKNFRWSGELLRWIR